MRLVKTFFRYFFFSTSEPTEPNFLAILCQKLQNWTKLCTFLAFIYDINLFLSLGINESFVEVRPNKEFGRTKSSVDHYSVCKQVDLQHTSICFEVFNEIKKFTFLCSYGRLCYQVVIVFIWKVSLIQIPSTFLNILTYKFPARQCRSHQEH